ncbi:MAG: hypothetical protein ACM3ZE_06060 [Myxococcales bacterium]
MGLDYLAYLLQSRDPFPNVPAKSAKILGSAFSAEEIAVHGT